MKNKQDKSILFCDKVMSCQAVKRLWSTLKNSITKEESLFEKATYYMIPIKRLSFMVYD